MKPQFLYDEKGNEAFVLLDVKTYRKLLDELENQYLNGIYEREKSKADREGYVEWSEVKAKLAKARQKSPHLQC